MDLTLTALLLVVLAPLSVVSTLYLWHLHREIVTADGRDNAPKIRLSFLLAAIATVATLIALFLAAIALAVLFGQRELSRELFNTGFYPSIVILDSIVIVIAAYLAWARRRSD